MADTLPTKVAGGDSDGSNLVGATYVDNPNYDHILGSFICEIGSREDTRIAKIPFKDDTTNAQIMAWGSAIDSATVANMQEIKLTLSKNTKRDKPALAESHRYLALATFEIRFKNGLVEYRYIRIPFVADSTKIPALKTFIESHKDELFFNVDDTKVDEIVLLSVAPSKMTR